MLYRGTIRHDDNPIGTQLSCIDAALGLTKKRMLYRTSMFGVVLNWVMRGVTIMYDDLTKRRDAVWV